MQKIPGSGQYYCIKLVGSINLRNFRMVKSFLLEVKLVGAGQIVMVGEWRK